MRRLSGAVRAKPLYSARGCVTEVAMTEQVTQQFQAEVSQVLRLVIHSLYSKREVFLRELVSNASDALDRLRFRMLQEAELVTGNPTLAIGIRLDAKARTIAISDNGVGMTEQELARNLGTIAWSGSRDFVEKLGAASSESERVRLIGQFGVGFYSSFLVAERVEVVSRAAGSAEAHRWTSTGESGYSIELAEREEQGTTVVLHLKEDCGEYLDLWRLQTLVGRYSDFVGHEITLTELEDGQPKGEPRRINQSSALWLRASKEVTNEQYQELYRHLTHDWQEPLGQRHFRIEGTQMFSGIIFLPKERPLDLFEPDKRHGVRLHVRRVLVMEDCDVLVPRWLRFIRGVVDSEDLPLNVSRETLQDERGVRIIRKQLVSQSLDLLEELARDKPEDYVTFWEAFGAVLKEGLRIEPDQRERLLGLVRYRSSNREAWISLKDYVAAMPEGQSALYYAPGWSKEQAESSPHLEALRKKGWEVLLMTDPVDPFIVDAIGDFEGKKLVSVLSEELPQEGEEATSVQDSPLTEALSVVLKERVKAVHISRRLTESPACLVVPTGALEPQVEQLLKLRGQQLPPNLRVLEVNPDHPAVAALESLRADESRREQFEELVETLYDQALLAEGSPPSDPVALAKRLASLMGRAAKAL
jgi:molecular chaperone HtpG